MIGRNPQYRTIRNKRRNLSEDFDRNRNFRNGRLMNGVGIKYSPMTSRIEDIFSTIPSLKHESVNNAKYAYTDSNQEDEIIEDDIQKYIETALKSAGNSMKAETQYMSNDDIYNAREFMRLDIEYKSDYFDMEVLVSPRAFDMNIDCSVEIKKSPIYDNVVAIAVLKYLTRSGWECRIIVVTSKNSTINATRRGRFKDTDISRRMKKIESSTYTFGKDWGIDIRAKMGNDMGEAYLDKKMGDIIKTLIDKYGFMRVDDAIDIIS